MSLWERGFAAVYDRVTRASEEAGVRERRRELLSRASGRVVEIGAGTGLNAGLYPDGVEELVLVEPSEPMARRLEQRLRDVSGPPARVVRADAQALPFADRRFDTAVATFVLCSVERPEAVLEELSRVLVPGGRLLFLEHVRAQDERLARWQHRLTPLQRRLARGCHLDRATPELIEASSLDVVELERARMSKAMPVLAPLAVGVAERAR